VLGEDDRRVGADADERLLTDRDQAAEARQHVPHRSEDDQDEELGELLGRGLGEHERDQRQHDGEPEHPAGEDAGDRRPAVYRHGSR
jgi:hypothetical protein